VGSAPRLVEAGVIYGTSPNRLVMLISLAAGYLQQSSERDSGAQGLELDLFLVVKERLHRSLDRSAVLIVAESRAESEHFFWPGALEVTGDAVTPIYRHSSAQSPLFPETGGPRFIAGLLFPA